MKKSKNQRKKEFLQRIKSDEIIEKTEDIKDSREDKEPLQEAPSQIIQDDLLRRIRGQRGKKNNERSER